MPRTISRLISQFVRAALQRRRAAIAVALGGLGVAVAVGVVSVTSAAADEPVAPVAAQTRLAADDQVTRLPGKGLPRASRNGIREQVSDLRQRLDKRAEAARLKAARQRVPDNPREIAMRMLPDYGWDASTFSCLDELWVGESNWDAHAENPTSGAYGIPQALPASKMASAGADWETNPATQIEWGLGYIRDVYGDPCAANSFKQANNWY